MKISVCMATYNGAKYISVQLRSILDQIGQEDELVIVDDQSVDNTVEIIKAFDDPRIRLYLNKVNLGAVRTFDRALHLVSGELIFLSDQDDRWYDNKVARVKGLFLSQNIDLLVHDARVTDGEQIISESLFDLCRSSPGVLRNIVSNTHTGCCMAFRRRVLDRVLPIPIKRGIFHDAWIGIMAGCFRYKKRFLREPLIDYRRHGGNVSTMKRRSVALIIPERTILIVEILKRIFQIILRRRRPN